MDVTTLKVNGQDYRVCNGTHYPENTPDALIHALERARESGKRVRLFYGMYDQLGEKLRVYSEENDVLGYVGRTCGSVKFPLLVHNTRSYGGGIIAANRIVAMRETKSRQWTYKHHRWTGAGPWTIKPLPQPGDTFAVIDPAGLTHALHLTAKRATNLVAFMQGHRFTK